MQIYKGSNQVWCLSVYIMCIREANAITQPGIWYIGSRYCVTTDQRHLQGFVFSAPDTIYMYIRLSFFLLATIRASCAVRFGIDWRELLCVFVPDTISFLERQFESSF